MEKAGLFPDGYGLYEVFRVVGGQTIVNFARESGGVEPFSQTRSCKSAFEVISTFFFLQSITEVLQELDGGVSCGILVRGFKFAHPFLQWHDPERCTEKVGLGKPL